MVARFLAAALHTAKANMAKIFHPLEIRDRNAARIGVHIRNNYDAPLPQECIGPSRHRPIRRLDNHTRLHPIGIVAVNNAFQGRRD